jgi:sec-independent protein translocase protein TatC
MRKFFRGIWRVITFPFRMLWRLFKLPFKAIKKASDFLNEEPEDRPISETLSTTFQQPGALLEHLEALRKHLLRMVVALVIGVGISAVFTQKIIDFLALPIGGISNLQAIEPTETVGVFMLVALICGFALALPYISFEIWLFLAPGLHARSRRIGLIGIPLALIFFVGGMAFTYYLLFPTALPFLENFLGVRTNWTISKYTNFVSTLLFWIGIFFEFPLVVYVLTSMGLIKPQFLAKQWRYAIVILAVLAAAITPTVDPGSMMIVMAPMALLYFVSVGLSYLAQAARRKGENKSPEQAGQVITQREN